MQISKIHIHNFRSIADTDINLYDQTILVGKNNVGKSNILAAIREFYNPTNQIGDRYTNKDKDTYIEIEFALTDAEYARFDKKYQINKNNILIRRKLLDGSAQLYGYTKDGLESKPMTLYDYALGTCIDVTYTDMREHVAASSYDTPQEAQIRRKYTDAFALLSRGEEWWRELRLDGGKSSLGTKKFLNIGIQTLSAETSQPVYKTGKPRGKLPKDTFVILLADEPDANLHPDAVAEMAGILQEFAGRENRQVMLATHSSQMISENVMDVNSIVRVTKEDRQTKCFQSNLSMSVLKDAIKNMVYFDRPRSDMFFADKVVLVEGPTDYNMYRFLKSQGEFKDCDTNGVVLIDCCGKWPMPYFQKILNAYNIPHSILIDLDGQVNSVYNNNVFAEFSGLTQSFLGWEKDLEHFCDSTKTPGNPAINMVQKYQDTQTISTDKKKWIVEVFKQLASKDISGVFYEIRNDGTLRQIKKDKNGDYKSIKSSDDKTLEQLTQEYAINRQKSKNSAELRGRAYSFQAAHTAARYKPLKNFTIPFNLPGDETQR